MNVLLSLVVVWSMQLLKLSTLMEKGRTSKSPFDVCAPNKEVVRVTGFGCSFPDVVVLWEVGDIEFGLWEVAGAGLWRRAGIDTW